MLRSVHFVEFFPPVEPLRVASCGLDHTIAGRATQGRDGPDVLFVAVHVERRVDMLAHVGVKDAADHLGVVHDVIRVLDVSGQVFKPALVEVVLHLFVGLALDLDVPVRRRPTSEVDDTGDGY
jgi:hypothetical protein